LAAGLISTEGFVGETETPVAETLGGFGSLASGRVAVSINVRTETGFANSLIGIGWTTTAGGMACAAGRESELETFAAEGLSGLGSLASGLIAVPIKARVETGFANSLMGVG
jgi:hypothetical protein